LAIIAAATFLIVSGVRAEPRATARDEVHAIETCVAEVKALNRQAIKRSDLIPFRHVPRDLWRVLPDETDCTEEGNNDVLRYKISWVKNCLKNIRYYTATRRNLPGPCWRDKKYYCTVYPGSDTCETFPANYRLRGPSRWNQEG
jgi:hypothetical protein